MMYMLTKKISKQTIEEMLHLADVTAHTGRELGFPLCDTGMGIERSQEISSFGRERKLIPFDDCGKHKKVGAFHTHPHGDNHAFPSFADIKTAYTVGLECISTKSKKYGPIVTCNERKDKFSSSVLDNIVELNKSLQEQKMRTRSKIEIVRTHFNTTLITKHPKTKNLIATEYKY